LHPGAVAVEFAVAAAAAALLFCAVVVAVVVVEVAVVVVLVVVAVVVDSRSLHAAAAVVVPLSQQAQYFLGWLLTIQTNLNIVNLHQIGLQTKVVFGKIAGRQEQGLQQIGDLHLDEEP
jgi:hypothetical protein